MDFMFRVVCVDQDGEASTLHNACGTYGVCGFGMVDDENEAHFNSEAEAKIALADNLLVFGADDMNPHRFIIERRPLYPHWMEVSTP